MEPLKEEEDQMIFANFNQDNSCFSIGTEKGYIIYNVYPYKEIFKRSIYIINKYKPLTLALEELKCYIKPMF